MYAYYSMASRSRQQSGAFFFFTDAKPVWIACDSSLKFHAQTVFARVWAAPRFLGHEFGNNSYISRTWFYLCESKIFANAFAALLLSLASSIYGNMSVMSRASDFWESIDNRWRQLLMVSTGGFTTYNTSVMDSNFFDNGFSWLDLGYFFNSVCKPHPHFLG
jgi:hypothetical protein